VLSNACLPTRAGIGQGGCPSSPDPHLEVRHVQADREAGGVARVGNASERVDVAEVEERGGERPLGAEDAEEGHVHEGGAECVSHAPRRPLECQCEDGCSERSLPSASPAEEELLILQLHFLISL